WLVHTLLLTMTGYSLTLLMASIFRRVIKIQPIWTLILSLIIVAVASSAFSVIETWSNATFVHPGARPVGIEYFGAILLNFSLLARLSSFLRYTLANEPTAKVTLAQEVETLKLYLEIEKMRFEDRLRPHFKIESETIGARLPSLLLQPLIENAIKYAVTPAENG